MLLKKKTKSDGDGWRCLNCGRVYAPTVPFCVACNGSIEPAQTPAEKYLDEESLSDFCMEKMGQMSAKMDSVIIMAAKGEYVFMAHKGNLYTCRGMADEMNQVLLGESNDERG